jgi:hypothetical protein
MTGRIIPTAFAEVNMAVKDVYRDPVTSEFRNYSRNRSAKLGN